MWDNYYTLVMYACAVPAAVLLGSAGVIVLWAMWKEGKA